MEANKTDYEPTPVPNEGPVRRNVSQTTNEETKDAQEQEAIRDREEQEKRQKKCVDACAIASIVLYFGSLIALLYKLG